MSGLRMDEPNLSLDLIDMVANMHVRLEIRGEGVERTQFAPRLKTLSLVSRSWLGPCQRILFQRFRLGLPPNRPYTDHLQVQRFEFLLSHPHIARYVLFLRIWIDHAPVGTEEVIGNIPTAFPHLEMFEVESTRPNTSPELATLITATLSQCSCLRSIYLVYMGPIDPRTLSLRTLHLENVHLVAPAASLLPLMRAVMTSCANDGQHLRQGTFAAQQCTQYSQLQEMYRLIAIHRTWRKLRIMHTGTVLFNSPPIDLDLSLGTYTLLTSLSIQIFTGENVVPHLHNMFTHTQLPALRQMTIVIAIKRTLPPVNGAYQVLIHIPVDEDKPRNLPSVLGRHLEELTFCFANSARSITLINWSEFLRLFQLPASCLIRYEHPNGALPRLE